ncbi:MAG: hypothetical protein VYC34_11375, partial [Planctomycetota bacterium]|nr:hypothetical protein [Planctomycetota bacterium]
MSTQPAERPPAPRRPPTPANRLGLDYRAEAARLGPPPTPFIDIHSHINGGRAAAIYREARDLYGGVHTVSMTPLTEVPAVQAAMGGTIEFIAVPNYIDADRRHAMTEGFLEAIQSFHDLG